VPPSARARLVRPIKNLTAVISQPAPLNPATPTTPSSSTSVLFASPPSAPQQPKTLAKPRPPQPPTSSGEMSFQGAKMPSAPVGGSALLKVGLLGGAGLYAVLNSFYNVEGGHRAIVFNRIEGIKEKVSKPSLLLPSITAAQW